MTIYLVAWTGGYDIPQYQAFLDRDQAILKAQEWAKDMEEGVDEIDVLEINADDSVGDVTVDRIEVKVK